MSVPSASSNLLQDPLFTQYHFYIKMKKEGKEGIDVLKCMPRKNLTTVDEVADKDMASTQNVSSADVVGKFRGLFHWAKRKTSSIDYVYGLENVIQRVKASVFQWNYMQIQHAKEERGDAEVDKEEEQPIQEIEQRIRHINVAEFIKADPKTGECTVPGLITTINFSQQIHRLINISEFDEEQQTKIIALFKQELASMVLSIEQMKAPSKS